MQNLPGKNLETFHPPGALGFVTEMCKQAFQCFSHPNRNNLLFLISYSTIKFYKKNSGTFKQITIIFIISILEMSSYL